MGKPRTITELVDDLQTENERLRMLNRLFNQACRSEFGYDVSSLHDIIEKWKQLEKKAG